MVTINVIPNKYSHIYYKYNKYGYLQLLFYNDDEKVALLFDRFEFHFQKDSIVFEGFAEMDYSKKSKHDFRIESIRQLGDWDMIFVKFYNGDLFQIYFMADDNDSRQLISIFSRHGWALESPDELNVYEAAMKRFETAEECLIDLKPLPNTP